MKEINVLPDWFKEVPWYEWYYAVNEFWDCISLPRIIHQKVNGVYKDCLYKWQKLKRDYWFWTQSKYWSYRFSVWNKTRKLKSHRIVAAAFLWLDLDDTKIFVCHIDDNPSNCCINNLLLWDHKINMWLAVKNWVHVSCSQRNKEQIKRMSEWNRKIPISRHREIELLRKQWYTRKQIWEFFWCHIDTAKHLYYKNIRWKSA